MKIAAIALCMMLAVDGNKMSRFAPKFQTDSKVRKGDYLLTITRQPFPAGRQGNRPNQLMRAVITSTTKTSDQPMTNT
jgi:hypothetical protein